MQKVIALLKKRQAEIEDVLAQAKRSDKPPHGWRLSEWAMHLGSLSSEKQQLFEAIQVLSKVGKD